MYCVGDYARVPWEGDVLLDAIYHDPEEAALDGFSKLIYANVRAGCLILGRPLAYGLSMDYCALYLTDAEWEGVL